MSRASVSAVGTRCAVCRLDDWAVILTRRSRRGGTRPSRRWQTGLRGRGARRQLHRQTHRKIRVHTAVKHALKRVLEQSVEEAYGKQLI